MCRLTRACRCLSSARPRRLRHGLHFATGRMVVAPGVRPCSVLQEQQQRFGTHQRCRPCMRMQGRPTCKPQRNARALAIIRVNVNDNGRITLVHGATLGTLRATTYVRSHAHQLRAPSAHQLRAPSAHHELAVHDERGARDVRSCAATPETRLPFQSPNCSRTNE